MKKKNRELAKINKILEEELLVANYKLIKLEKDYQNSTCEMTMSNIYRLKESTSKSIILTNQDHSRWNSSFEKSVPMKGYLQGEEENRVSLPSSKPRLKTMMGLRDRILSTKNY